MKAEENVHVINFVIDSRASEHLIKETDEQSTTDVKILNIVVRIRIEIGQSLVAENKGKTRLKYENKKVTLEGIYRL